MAPISPRPGQLIRALILENDDSARSAFQKLLIDRGYDCIAVATAGEAATRLGTDDPFDVVIAAADVPGALDIVSELGSGDAPTATVIVTPDDPNIADAALAAGAYGYVLKPAADASLLLNISNAVHHRQSESLALNHASRLEQMLRDRTGEVWSHVTKLEQTEREMRLLQEEFIHRLSLAAEFRDDETRRHLRRMGHYTALIADRLGWPPERCEMIRIASAMHDVGKIGIPDQILMKPGELTEAEWEIMKRHCQIGHRILSGSNSELLNLAATIALTHHEKVDGSGYPYGLTGDQIPAVGRMAAVADVFDALTSDKVYRRGIPFNDAFKVLGDDRGTHFDAEMVDIFLSEKGRILGIKDRYADKPPGEDEMSQLSALAADV